MSNVGHKCLLKLGKSALCYHHGPLQNFYNRPEFAFHSSTSRRIERKTFDESKTADESENKTDRRSESSSHRQFHRYSYERKRTNYQRERAESNGNHRSEPLLANRTVNHYQRLNVDQTADAGVIKSAYYSLSKQYHPDLVGSDNPDASEQFRLITESYDILSDPKARLQYDSSLAHAAQTSPQFTSWSPAGSGDTEQEHLYRMREAGQIFRTKQEELFERERLKNPQKFRAGIFKADTTDVNYQNEIDKLDRQIRDFGAATRHQSTGDHDTSRFYREHMRAAVRRRREDLLGYRDLQPRAEASDDTVLLGTIALLFGGVALVVLMIADSIYDFDLAAALDDKLVGVVDDIKAKKGPRAD